MKKQLWQKATNNAYKLNSNVHLWLLRYSKLQESENSFYSILCDEEKKMADKFLHENDHVRYTVSKGYLRLILGKITTVNPDDIIFTANEHGKPELKFPEERIYFNISHSGDLGLIAITDLAPIGVDVEKYSERKATNDLVIRFFSPAEQDMFFKLPEFQRTEGFFNCWSRKEAFVKSLGKGLSFPLSSFDVSLKPEAPAQLLEIRNKEFNTVSWSLNTLTVDDGYAAAFCINTDVKFPTSYWLA